MTLSLTHSRPAERGSGQAIQARPDHPTKVVSPSRGLPLNMQQVAPAQNRLNCHEVRQQVASVCVTGTGSPGHSSGCAQSAMVGFGSIHLTTISHIGQSGGGVAGLPMQENHSVMYHSSGGLRPPPVKSVADFLMDLFQDRKLQPSTIDGYRSAIADRLGNSPISISKDEISLVSWIVSTETDPKARRESPPRTSPWFLHQLARFILNQLKRPP